jgi:alcohol dehydrogenase class IV
VFEYNVSKGYSGYSTVYDLLPDSDKSLGDMEKSADFAKRFRKLYEDIGASRDLSEYGVKRSDIGRLVSLTMEQRKLNLDLNPVAFGQDALTELFEKVVR